MKFVPALLLGRLARVFIRQFRKGGGSALPGLILSKFAPGILYKTLHSFRDGLVVVTGSAGKSTTTKMLVAIARAHGKTVFTNPSTANILQGFYSTIIEQSNFRGAIKADIAILEMDEGHAALLVQKIAPRTVAILNVMEDQLDRFVDPALVRDTLAKVAAAATTDVVLNADDENLRLLANSGINLASVSWFGITQEILQTQRNGLGTAPTYLPALARPQVSSEVVAKSGLTYEVLVGGTLASVELASRGLHFAVDATCALETARRVLGDDFDVSLAARTITDLPPVFARGEVVEINGEEVEFVLVQNPGSMQLNLDNLDSKAEQIMFAIGRDVHDPSWMWTVDYERLKHVDVSAASTRQRRPSCLAMSVFPSTGWSLI